MSLAYYNEIEPYAAQWLRNLIASGEIAPGEVDTRSIVDVQPNDLAGFAQCHFFAGMGGWSLALRDAGVRDDAEVWTGSCPCQPFSVAGKGGGFDDPRDLWPQFRRLIEKRRPPVVYGEQSANAASWLARLRGDLETLDYAVGCIPVEAASASADHFRDRFWFVADYDFERSGDRRLQRSGQLSGASSHPQDHDGRVSDLSSERGNRGENPAGTAGRGRAEDLRSGTLVNDPGFGWGEGWTEHEFRSRGFTAAVASVGGGQYLECPDGKWRRLPPPRVRWLGTRLPSRVSRLRAIGNAIDRRPAAAFIRAHRHSVGRDLFAPAQPRRAETGSDHADR